MYTAKVWFTTIIISPVILSIAEGFINFDTWHSVYISVQLLVVMILCSLAFSAPTIIAQYLLFTFLQNSKSTNHLVKISLSTLAILGVFLTFYIIDSHSFSFKNNFLFWPITYTAIMVASIWYYRLNITKSNKPLHD